MNHEHIIPCCLGEKKKELAVLWGGSLDFLLLTRIPVRTSKKENLSCFLRGGFLFSLAYFLRAWWKKMDGEEESFIYTILLLLSHHNNIYTVII